MRTQAHQAGLASSPRVDDVLLLGRVCLEQTVHGLRLAWSECHSLILGRMCAPAQGPLLRVRARRTCAYRRRIPSGLSICALIQIFRARYSDRGAVFLGALAPRPALARTGPSVPPLAPQVRSAAPALPARVAAITQRALIRSLRASGTASSPPPIPSHRRVPRLRPGAAVTVPNLLRRRAECARPTSPH